MSHGLEKFDIDHSIYAERPWHGLGEVTGQALTVEDVRRALDYRIERHAPVVMLDDGTTVEVPNAAAHLRIADGMEPYAFPKVMSGTYTLTQPSELFPQFAEMAERQGFEIVSVGTLRQGAKWYMSVRLPAEFSFEINGKDRILPFISFGDACDGTSTLQGVNAIERVVCQNTFAAYLTGAEKLFRVKHTKHAQAQVSDLLAGLEHSIETSREIQACVERLVDSAYTEADFMALIKGTDSSATKANSLLGARPVEDDRGRTFWDKAFDQLVESYHHENLDGIRETKFGALNAVQYRTQHMGQVRGGVSRGIRHAERINSLSASKQTLEHKAAELLGALV